MHVGASRLRVGASYPGSQLPVRHSLHFPESLSLASSCHHQDLGLRLFRVCSGVPTPAWGRGGRDSGAIGSVGWWWQDSAKFRSAVPLGPVGTGGLEGAERVCICSLSLWVSSEDRDD